MDIVTASSFKLTLATVKKSVESFPLSLKFMKKLVPISISTVLSERLNSDPANFHHYHYGETEYYVVKKTPKDPKFKELFDSLHGVIEAIENEYLKELHLIIVEGSTDRILEKYKYRFYYNKEGLDVDETKKMKRQVFMSLTKHLTDIKNGLQRVRKLPEDSKSHILLTYYDYTPKTYEPFSFKEGSDKSHLIGEQLCNEIRIPFEKVSTGFHTVSCSGRIPELLLEYKKNVENKQVEEENVGEKRKLLLEYKKIDENKQVEEENVGEKRKDIINQNRDDGIEELINPLGETTISIPSNGGIDESWDLTMSNDRNSFNCICGIHESINLVETVPCSLCNLCFHYPCVSVFMNEFPEKFVCWDCAQKAEGIQPTNVTMTALGKEQHEKIAIRFLIIFCILESKSYPEAIINKLSKDKRKGVVYFLEENRYITFRRNIKKPIVDFNALREYVDSIKNAFEEDTSRLPESEEPVPKRSRTN